MNSTIFGSPYIAERVAKELVKQRSSDLVNFLRDSSQNSRMGALCGYLFEAVAMTTRKKQKHTFDLANQSRYMREDYRSLAYGHKDANPLISMEKVIENYHLRKQYEQGD